MSNAYHLAAMTSPEFDAARKNIRIALQPIGATEQHGPNLAMGTDFRAADAVSQRLAERLYPKAITLPPIAYGFSGHHMGFPGTITLSPETILGLLRDVGRSVKAHGIDGLLLVNGHNGNNAILNVAATTLRYESDLKTAVMFYFQQASDVVKRHAKTDRYGHACEIETSALLDLAPDCVRHEALQVGGVIPSDRQFADNRSPFALQVPIPFAEQTSNGAFGDARLANQEVGREIVDKALERAVAFADSYFLS